MSGHLSYIYEAPSCRITDTKVINEEGCPVLLCHGFTANDCSLRAVKGADGEMRAMVGCGKYGGGLSDCNVTNSMVVTTGRSRDTRFIRSHDQFCSSNDRSFNGTCNTDAIEDFLGFHKNVEDITVGYQTAVEKKRAERVLGLVQKDLRRLLEQSTPGPARIEQAPEKGYAAAKTHLATWSQWSLNDKIDALGTVLGQSTVAEVSAFVQLGQDRLRELGASSLGAPGKSVDQDQDTLVGSLQSGRTSPAPSTATMESGDGLTPVGSDDGERWEWAKKSSSFGH